MYIPRQKSYISGKNISYGIRNSLFADLNSRKPINTFRSGLASYLNVDNLVLYPSLRISFLEVLRYYKAPEGSEIILPVHSYPGLLKIMKQFNLKPIFVDLDMTLNADLELIKNKITDKTRFILVPHHYGIPFDIPGLKKKIPKDIIIIEDAAQSFGAKVENRYVGTLGDVGLFSFSRGKLFDLIGGSAIITEDNRLKEFLIQRSDHYKHSRIIFLKKCLIYYYIWLSSSTMIANFTTFPFQRLMDTLSKSDVTANMIAGLFSDKRIFTSKKKIAFNSLQARFGLQRLSEIDRCISSQRKSAAMYETLLSDNKKITLPKKQSESFFSTFQYFPILVNKRDQVASFLLKRGIDTKRDFHSFMCNNYEIKNYPLAKKISEQILHIPIYSGLKKKDISYIAKNLNEATDY